MFWPGVKLNVPLDGSVVSHFISLPGVSMLNCWAWSWVTVELDSRSPVMSLPKYRLPFAAMSVFKGVPGASAACAPVLPSASDASAVAATAPAVIIRRRTTLPGDLVASDAGRNRHIFMALLVIESYRRKLR